MNFGKRDVKRIVVKLKKPRLFLSFLREYVYINRLKSKVGEVWESFYSDNLKKRAFSSYEEYLIIQGTKIKELKFHEDTFNILQNYDNKYQQVLHARLKELNISWNGKIVLCLGARLGTEVRSFISLGCFAIGIDISPGEQNKYVLYGDFHNIQFPPASVDIIFTNCLDHVFDIGIYLEEIKKVLKSEGVLIIEACKGTDEGKSPGFYESLWWSKIEDLLPIFDNYQLKCINRSFIDYPWQGEQLVFTKKNSIV